MALLVGYNSSDDDNDGGDISPSSSAPKRSQSPIPKAQCDRSRGKKRPRNNSDDAVEAMEVDGPGKQFPPNVVNHC